MFLYKRLRSILLKGQNLFSTTAGVERIHFICINYPENPGNSSEMPAKLSKVGFWKKIIKIYQKFNPTFLVSDWVHKSKCYIRNTYAVK